MTAAWETCKELYLQMQMRSPGRSKVPSQANFKTLEIVMTQTAMHYEAALLLVFQEVHVIPRFSGRDSSERGGNPSAQVGNTIGKRNRFLFLAFLIIETVAMTAGAIMAILRIHQASTAMEWADAEGLPWIVAFIIGDGFMLFGVTALMATQVSTGTSD